MNAAKRVAAAISLALFLLSLGATPVLAAAPQADFELQTEMLGLINREREAHDLTPLVMNTELTEVALAHAHDMIERDYFSHWSPDKLSPADRFRLAGVKFEIMGENIAGNTSVSHAHSMLMESPTHCDNILQSRFQEAGVGIVKGGRYGYMIVMVFKG